MLVCAYEFAIEEGLVVESGMTEKYYQTYCVRISYFTPGVVINSWAHMKPCQTSTLELFCEKRFNSFMTEADII